MKKSPVSCALCPLGALEAHGEERSSDVEERQVARRAPEEAVFFSMGFKLRPQIVTTLG